MVERDAAEPTQVGVGVLEDVRDLRVPQGQHPSDIVKLGQGVHGVGLREDHAKDVCDRRAGRS